MTWSPGSARPKRTSSSRNWPHTAWPATRRSSSSRPQAWPPGEFRHRCGRGTIHSEIADPSFDGTATLTLVSGPAGAKFTPVTAPVSDGTVVFQGLSLSKIGGGYKFQVAIDGLTSTNTNTVNRVRVQARGRIFLSAACRQRPGGRCRRGGLE